MIWKIYLLRYVIFFIYDIKTWNIVECKSGKKYNILE